MTATRTAGAGPAQVVAGRGRQRGGFAPSAALGLLAGLLVAGGFALGAYLPNLHNGLIAAAFAAVGVFVLAKRPGNPEGRLFLATGLAHAVMFLARQYGLYSAARDTARELPGAAWVTWLGVWPLPLVMVLAGVTFMCFPDGRLPSRRWRPVVAAMAGWGAALALLSALWPVEYADNALDVRHPFQLAGHAAARQVWDAVGPPSYLLFQALWVACVALRMRRARGDEARQLRWFAYAVVLDAAAMALSALVLGSPLLGVLALPVIALAAGSAVVKYRLYDIDPVINKTLVLGAMAAMITAGYVAVVIGVGGLVGLSAGQDADQGGNLVLPLVATALVAVAFDPLRRRVQAAADRLVHGRRPTPYEALARLSAQLNAGGRHDDLFTGLAATVAQGVGAARVTLWVGPGAELVPVAHWPETAEPGTGLETAPRELAALRDGDRTWVGPVVHRGVTRGAVTLTKRPGEPLTTGEERLLNDLVAQAGLVLDNVGLGVELQRRLHQISVQAAELRAAAKRIVAAQDEARRCLERDLHDGAQQRLVTLALGLRTLSERAAAGGDLDLAEGVEEARGELRDALAELRELARGIHPAILSQEGLGAALGFLAERAPVPVRVEAPLERRLAAEVESAAYLTVSEALTNAAKHADASCVTVTGRLRDGRLTVEVSDDGRGGADGCWGHGLQGLADRLATLNGRLTVRSPHGGGTRLRAEIPCG